MNLRQCVCPILLVSSAFVPFTNHALAQTLGPYTAGPADLPPVASITVADSLNGLFELGTSGELIQVSYDPAAGPLEKVFEYNFDFDGDGGFTSSDFVLLSQQFPAAGSVTERFVVGDGPDWLDWHEEILTDGFAWGDAVLSVDGVVVGSVSGGMGDSEVSFLFPPAPTGSVVEITKDLLFTDAIQQQLQPILGSTNPILPLVVREHPTVPEPATATTAIVAMGCLTAISRRLNR